MKFLKKADPEIYELIKSEEKRQAETLMMIPSENLASSAVEEAVGSVLGNKYAEGYPFKRYYQGQKNVDQIENLVIERTKKIFAVPAVNVQPLSGSQANLAVYVGLLTPGEKIMGLSLNFGGHLTHGTQVSVTGRFFQSVSYELNKQGLIDYDELEDLAKREKPKIIVAGITAYPRRLEWEKFLKIAQNVDAYLMADIAHLAGLVIGGAYPSPVPYVHIVTTTTHKTLRGPRGAMIMTTEKGLKKDPALPDKINKAVFPGLQGGPHINTIAGIGVALKEASNPRFKLYAKQIVKNAKILASELKKYNFNLVSGGTDSHLILIDLRNKNLLGNLTAEALEKAGIVLNRNSVPYDPSPPFYPSGIRLGTPGITSRGMRESEMKIIASQINQAINAVIKTKAKLKIDLLSEKKKAVRQQIVDSTADLQKIGKTIKQLCRQFPIRKRY